MKFVEKLYTPHLPAELVTQLKKHPISGVDQEIAVLRGEYTKAERGRQIRSYVLHPYQMVKDHRTEHETGNSQAVLDGDLDGFMEAYLKSAN